MTDAEQLLWRELRRTTLGWRFRRQYPVSPYIADFACIEARLIIELDGGQHAVPGEHDHRDQILRRQGWRVLRFWNNEVLENRAGVLRVIAETLGPRLTRYPLPGPPPLAGEGASNAGSKSASPPPLAGEG